MQDSIFVVGHRNPDTDSICAAVAYAELKRRQGISAVEARAGEISREQRREPLLRTDTAG